MRPVVDVFAAPPVREELGRSPLVFVDVGAAVGAEEPWRGMLRAAPELTAICGFEPHPDSFAALERLPNGTYHNIAIASVNGRAPFYLWETASSLADRSSEQGSALRAIEVETRRLDTLRSDGTVRSLDIVKTDCELRDFDALASAGSYLASEVLAVQCEFAWDDAREPPFRKYDELLSRAGFLLFGLSVYRGAVGEIAGGNLLYLRSIWSALNGAEARRRALKLLAVAVTLGNLGYAHAIVRASQEVGVLTPAEGTALRELCFKRVFVPDAWGGGRIRSRIASVFGMGAQLAAGLFWRAVSTPESNRLGGYPWLYRRPSPLWRRSRVEQRYDAYYAEFRRQRPRG